MQNDTTNRPRRTFADAAGRNWILTITIGGAMRVRDELGIDLLKGETETTVLELAGDPLNLCAIVWLLVADQAEKANVDRDSFWSSMVDDSIEAATFAFLDALIDFFPKRRQAALRRVVEKMREASEKQLAHLQGQLDAGLVDQAIDGELARQLATVDRALAKMAATPGKSCSS